MAEEKQEKKAQQAQPKEEQKEEAKVTAKKAQQKREERLSSIVRLAGKDVNGSLNIERAIDQVRGVGSNMSHALTFAIEKHLNIPKTSNLGSLSEQQMESLENLIKNPEQFGIPVYMLNRRKDMETGKNMHLVSNDLLFSTRQDVNRDVTLRLWRGFRHQYGQKVRGQRTRSTGRKGATIGVTKKQEAPKGGGGATPSSTGSSKGATPSSTGAPKKAAPAPAAPPAGAK